MTLTEARKILGLGSDEDPRPRLGEFRIVREKIAEMVRIESSGQQAQKYLDDLDEFDQALVAVRTYLEDLGLLTRDADIECAERGHPVFVKENLVSGDVALPKISGPAKNFSENVNPVPATRSLFRVAAWTMLFLILTGFGGWTYLKEQLVQDARVAFLERKGTMSSENRNGSEAAKSFDEKAEAKNEPQPEKDKADAVLHAARKLMGQAAALDTGEFDQKPLDLLREALALAPDDKEVVALYEKFSAYKRTVRIPGDFKTVQEALASAGDKDRLVIAEGTWEGPLLISAGVELEGTPGKTIIQCAADEGSVITFAPGVLGAQVNGLTLRHLSFDASKERFSLVLVSGAKVNFSDCRFEQGSGHGIAITDGGHARVQRCRFTENGWNGIAAMGKGSLLVAEDNTLFRNSQNGIEAWDGAAVILTKNICTGNSRNGIHVDSGTDSVTILDNTLSGNREFGLVLSAAGGGEVTENTMTGNSLGGMVVKAEAVLTAVRSNTITDNHGHGLLLGKGLSGKLYTTNRSCGNEGSDMVTDVDLSGEE